MSFLETLQEKTQNPKKGVIVPKQDQSKKHREKETHLVIGRETTQLSLLMTEITKGWN